MKEDLHFSELTYGTALDICRRHSGEDIMLDHVTDSWCLLQDRYAFPDPILGHAHIYVPKSLIITIDYKFYWRSISWVHGFHFY
jgi:hypothetical protein